MGKMSVMGRGGDTRLTWDPAKPEDVAAAKRAFDDLAAKGYLAFSLDAADGKGEQIKAFDPAAARIILAPPMAGGA